MEPRDKATLTVRCQLSKAALLVLLDKQSFMRRESALLTEGDADWAQALFGDHRYTDDGPGCSLPAATWCPSPTVADVTASLHAALVELVKILGGYSNYDFGNRMDLFVSLAAKAGVPQNVLHDAVLC